jgi:hypothetical protein
MGQTVKLRRSAVSGRVPNNSQLQLGELSMNTTDGKIFLAKSGSGGPSIEEVIITNTQNTGSLDIVGSISGSFLTGSFIGDGSGLYNIPASGVTGLSLDKISSGASTASIDANGLQINVNTSITGSLTATEFTGSGLGLRNVPINVSGSDENSITYDGQFTQFLFDDSTGIKVSGDTSTGTAKIYLDGVAAENEGGIGVTAKLEVTGATSTWTFDHDLGEQYPAITVFDSDGYVIIPQNIEAVSSTQLVITFSSPQTGVATATIGGGLPAISSSYGGRLLTVNSDGTFAEWKESIYLQTGSFETYTSSVNDRFNSIESFTSSIDETYATDEDVTDLRNDLNLYTSSTDDRLDSLETASGSLNSFTSSINTTIKTKLNTETVVSGSEQVVSLLSNQDVDLGTGDITAVTGSFGQLSIDDTIRATNFTGSFLRLDQNGEGLRMTNVGAFDNDGSNNFRIFSTNDLIIATGGDSGTAITIDSSTKDVTFQGNIVLSGTVDGVDVSELKTNYDTSTGSHDGRLDSLETESGSIRTTLNSYTSSANGRLDDLENGIDDLRIESGSIRTDFNSYTSSTDDRLDSIETTSGSHNTRIGNLETFETKVDNGLEFTGSNVTIKGNLLVKGTETRVDSTTVDLSDNIISLNGSGASNAGIEVRDTTSPGLLSGSLIWDSTNNYWLGGTKSNEERLLTNTDLTNLDGRLDSLETDSGSIRSDFNSYTSSNDNNINGIDGRLGSLETTSGSHDGRLDSLESFTSSIDDTYATDQDITDLRGDFNTYTSSNDTTNTTQNSRLTSLESATGSYTTTDYYTTGATFNQINGVVTGTRNDGGTWTVDLDGRYLTGYTESDPIFSASPSANIADSDIENWNLAHGWGDHSQAGYLTSHPNVVAATSSNNSGRTYIQDILLDSNGHVTGLTTSTETVVNTDEYTTGVTWNGTTAVLTFTRNDGDTYSVTMLETLSDVTVTGGTYNSGTQTLRLTKSDGSTVDVSGFAVDTDTNWYTTGATFNNTNGILTIVGKGMSDVTVDLDGRYLTGYTETDPIFSASPSANIADSDIENWNLAHGWGDHSQVGYLTSYSETDTLQSVTSRGSTTTNTVTVGSSTHRGGTLQVNDYNSNTDGMRIYGYSNNEILSLISRYDQADGGLFFKRGNNGSESTIGEINWVSNQFRINAQVGSLAVMTGGFTALSIDSNQLVSLSSGLNITAGDIDMGTNTITDTKVGQWDTAYGWGDHSTQGYLTSYNNEYVTGASWNNSTAVLTFTRNDGDTFSVTLLDTLSDVTVTGGTYDSGTQTLELTKNDGSTISVSGFAIDTDINYYLTGSTFNTSDGVLTLKVKGSSDVTVDLDGRYLTGYTETDPIFSASPSANIADSDIENWNLAHGWGDHSQAGYLTTYNNEYTTGATFNSSNGIITFTRNDGDTFTVDLDGRYLTSYSETDTLDSVVSRGNTTARGITLGSGAPWAPLVINASAGEGTANAGVAIALDGTDYAEYGYRFKANGSNYYQVLYNGSSINWKHYSSGYSTKMSLSNGGNLTLTGTISASGYNDSNWNTAYGWGDHSQVGYLTSYNNEYTTGATFNAGNGIITFTRNDGDTFTVDIDGRFLTSYSETDTLNTVTSRGSTTSNSISVGDFQASHQSAQDATTKAEMLSMAVAKFKPHSTNSGTLAIAQVDNGNSVGLQYTNGAGTSDWDMSLQPFGGNVGINKINPSGAFHVYSGTSERFLISGDVHVQGSTDLNINGTSRRFSFTSGTGTIRTTTANALYLQTNSTTAVTIDANQNVAITGTLSASGYNKTNWDTAYGWGDHSQAGYLTGVTNISGYSGTLLREDNRSISPSELSSGRLKFGFTSWNNNNTSPYADFIHMRSYTDSSGGSDNLVMFKKDGIGMRLWQQTYGSETAYSSYADVWTSNDFTSTNVSNWNTAYGWGDHSQVGYLTSYNNEYVTGASWNSSTAVLTFTRNDGDTFNVNLLNTLSDVTVTGGTYSSGTQTLTLTKSDGNTVSVSGFAIDTDVNYYTTGATFNTGNGVITGTLNNGSTWTVDIDGRYLPLAGGTLSGNLTVGATNKTSDTVVRSLADQSYKAGFEAYGNGQGTGYLYVGQSADYGGGISYNGDGSPAFVNGETADYITFYRREAGTNTEVFAFPYSNNNVYFNGEVHAGGGNSSQWNTAVGWGDHSQVGYLTTYNNEYTTGATFNTGNGIITFKRNDGDTYTVDIDGRFSLSSHTHSSFGDMVTFETARTLNEDWENSPISVLERDSIGNGDTSDTYSPNINFHWRNRVSRSIWMDYTGDFHFGEYTAQGVPENTGAIYVGGGNSDQWNTAYGWGDHSSVGYITSYSETDTLDSVVSRGSTTSSWVTVGSLLISNTAPLLDLVDTNSFTDTNDRFRIRAAGNVGQVRWYDASAATDTVLMTFNPDGTIGVDGTIDMGTNTITDTKVGQWDTAYGWGNHAGRYMTQGQTLTDINTIVNGGNRYDPSTDNPTNEHYAVLTYGNGGNVTGQLATHFQTGKLYSRGHNNSWSGWRAYWSDSDFTSTNVSNWNTAYGWGDHSTEGYWTSHADTSTLSGQYGGANNGVVIEDITVDSNGHVTAVGTRDLDGRFLGISATAADSDKLDTYQLAGSTSVSTVIFNNKGQIHDTNQDFNTVMTPGPNYMRKGTNGPTGVENDQWYGLMLGLGSDYGTSTGSSGHYGNQLYWGRQSQGDNTYLWARDMEGGSWGSWRKMSAGYADSAGSATSAGNADTLDGQHGSYYTNAGNLTGTIGDVFSASTRYNIGFIDGSSSQSRDKLRVWSDGSYSIGMKNGYDFGHLGSGEYAMSFQMDTTPGRGWWWGTSTQTDDQGVMALTNDGRLNVSTSISIGEGKSTTSPSTTPLYVEGTTSGSTVFEVQGTQGQLFSITDSLVGDIFEVSDISGIPILSVNSNGVVTIDDTLHVTGDVFAYYSSDERLKDNVKPIENSLDKIKMIGGYEFDWNDLSRNNTGHDVGVIAQEIEKVLPEVVGTRGDGFKGVKYEKLTALLIQANKELIQRVEELESKLKNK